MKDPGVKVPPTDGALGPRLNNALLVHAVFLSEVSVSCISLLVNIYTSIASKNNDGHVFLHVSMPDVIAHCERVKPILDLVHKIISTDWTVSDCLLPLTSRIYMLLQR